MGRSEKSSLEKSKTETCKQIDKGGGLDRSIEQGARAAKLSVSRKKKRFHGGRERGKEKRKTTAVHGRGIYTSGIQSYTRSHDL